MPKSANRPGASGARSRRAAVGEHRTITPPGSSAATGTSSPATPERPTAAGSALVTTIVLILSGSQSALLPVTLLSTRAASTSARSTGSPDRWRRTTFARVAASPRATAPVATSPAAEPATVASTQSGKTLFVPVLSGTSGAAGQASATSRHVPSPPSTTRQPTPSCDMAAAAVPLSWRLSVSGVSSSVHSTSRPSRARRPSCWRSGITTILSAPASTAPMATRRMMDTFVASEVTVAWATSRRTSLPALGLAMMPTVATGTSVPGAHRGPHGVGHCGGVGDVRPLERGAERHRRERRAEPHDRRVEVVERRLLDLGGDLGADPAERARPRARRAPGWCADATRRSSSVSRGCTVRGSMTSHSRCPSPASCSAAVSASTTIRPRRRR